MSLGCIFMELQWRLTVHSAGQCLQFHCCGSRIDGRMLLDKYKRWDDMGDQLGDL